MSALILPAKVLAAWLVVDLISGVVHWAEDSYGHPDLPFVGRRITKPNLLHHFRPRAFVTNSWFASSRLLIYSCLLSIAIAWAIGKLSPMVFVAAILGANANQVHKWSHRSAAENGVLVTLAQRVGLLQSPTHHNRHHVGQKDSNYCVMTGLVNPLLDGFRVWRGLEWVLRVCGLPKRDDDALLAQILAVQPDFLDRPS